MPAAGEDRGGRQPPRLPIPEIRDYHRINAELISLLDAGHVEIYLDGAEAQRLLASGLRGSWEARIEILGHTGPELAAGLDAPGLTIVARGDTADGAGRGLRQGCLIVLGSATDGLGFGQYGGSLIVDGTAGHRAGLAQAGGSLWVLGGVGRLAADRQSGGRTLAPGLDRDPTTGRGRSGGRAVDLDSIGPIPDDDRDEWARIVDQVARLR